MHYDRNGRQYDYRGKGNLEYQDPKFAGDHRAIKPETRTAAPDDDYSLLKPRWCDICAAKIACHHKES